MQQALLPPLLLHVLPSKKPSKKYRFIDLCAGIGTGRLGLEKAGFECVGYSEINASATYLYEQLHGKKHPNQGDLTLISAEQLPSCDLLIAGFPCQTFSIVGKRKGLDDDRGQIIYHLVRLLKAKQIPYFIFENVKGLVNLQQGAILKEIITTLEEAGYSVHHNVLNSLDYGVPQSRERIYFVGVRRDLEHQRFVFPAQHREIPRALKDCLIETDTSFILQDNTPKYDTFLRYLQNKYNKGQYTLEELLRHDYLVLDTRQSDLRLYQDKVPTLRTGRHGILYVKEGQLRALSAKEAMRLQGFSEAYINRLSDYANTDLLSKVGNAMSIPVIQALGEALMPIMHANETKRLEFTNGN
jgi:DNA (cytosine-5)-methyltransferase 1